MTKSRRPANFPLPDDPRHVGEDEEELEGEESEDSDDEEQIESENDDPAGSTPPTPLTREIMMYKEMGSLREGYVNLKQRNANRMNLTKFGRKL